MSRAVDRPFLVLVGVLLLGGFFIFSSASLGLLAREGIEFSAVALNQGLSLLIGIVGLFVAIKIPYRFWNKYAPLIFLASIIFTLLVFIPGLGFSHAGATRWIDIGPISIQPAEFLKLGFIIFFATWLTGVKQKVETLKYGVLPLAVILVIVGAVLGAQPDLGTFMVIGLTGVGMFVVAGGKWKHIFSMGAAAIILVIVLGFSVPYINSRLKTFLDPSLDPLGSGYQIQQSLIAIGSGEWFGRGFGQSVQKFNFLPEPIGDSIFAVFAEEWGFTGAVVLLGLFVALALRGFRIAERAPSIFSRLLVSGIIIMISVQTLINMGAMLGIVPLTGLPLLFVSQGGSALLMVLVGSGMVLQVSKFQRLR